MKILPFCLLAFAACLCACSHKPPKPAASEDEPDYTRAEKLLYVNNDSAFYYFNKVATGSKDSLQIAMSYNNMAVIQGMAGDYFGSQESLLTSLQYLNEQQEKDHACLASDYNELGSASLNLKNYDAAITYYDLAIKFTHAENYKRVFLNNKALVYQKKQDYAQAIAIYLSIIEQSKKDKTEYARVLSNLAKTKWLQNPDYPAAPELLAALAIRTTEKDEWGQNASYAHLSDYYKRSRPDSALLYADHMLTVARQLDSPDDELEALQKLMLSGTSTVIQQYFTRYQFLSDSLQTARNAAKNQFALIRYEAQKNKADNLRLQKENAEKKVQLIRREFWMYGISALFVVAVVVAVLWYKRKRQKLQWEADKAMQDHLLKTSQKVHDVVANGLYRLRVDYEHGVIGKEVLLNKLDDLYVQSRDLSYEKPDSDSDDFDITVNDLLHAFRNGHTQVLTVNNSKNVWAGVTGRIRKEVVQVLQELMINMKKHSQAQLVIVKFTRQDNIIVIRYTDDGIGLPESFQYGNGLTSTENRITGLGGNITFEKNTKGLKIHISFPIR